MFVPLAQPVPEPSGAGPAPSEQPSPSATPSTDPSAGGGLGGLDPEGAAWFVGVVLLVLIALLVFAVLYDIRTARHVHDKRHALLENLVARPDVNNERVAQLAGNLTQPTTGIEGLTRTLVALTILVAVVLSLLTTVVSTSPGSAELRITLTAGVSSVFATIVGFYFGSRTAQTSADAENRRRSDPTDTSKVAAAVPPTSVAAGGPGRFLPWGAEPSPNLAVLSASKLPADPLTRWPTGSYVDLKDGSQAHWDGNSWTAGRAP
ncbi:hypothetical protein [Virgisporangium ochraceum]|uniref:DUF2510 domain-containing protein n=1 Tax=Virgisporangium ochraceum TaxID=65505 RepID=A0A8J3ZWD3_9ACTN|nr:hypothetical protein [Virgisporangium ochraceum]GIJ71234.1 hypothetical protein Voc01_061510 [Virgisporangium ochraceum]